jgi:hypothetical protein
MEQNMQNMQKSQDRILVTHAGSRAVNLSEAR